MGLMQACGADVSTGDSAAPRPQHPRLVLERHLTLAPKPGNPRNSEGDFVQLKDGRWLFIYTHFMSGADDHSRALLAARESSDGGRSWSENDTVVVSNEGGFNVMSVSLRRLKSGRIALFYLRKNSLQDCRPILRLSDDEGKTWRRSRTLLDKDTSGSRVNFMEPGLVEVSTRRILMVIRTKLGCQYLSESGDQGENWTPPQPSALLSPEAPATLIRIPSTGDLLVVWNDHCGQSEDYRRSQPPIRTPLAAAISRDGGRTWENEKLVEDRAGHGYCYIAVAFAGERVLLAYCAHPSSYGLETTQISSFRIEDLYR